MVDLRLKVAALAMLLLTLPGFAGSEKKAQSKQNKEFVKRCSPKLQGKWHSIDLKHFPLNDGYKQPPVVSFIIQEDGSVTDVRLVKSSGSPTVDNEIVKETGLNRYDKRLGCGPIEVKMSMNIDFG